MSWRGRLRILGLVGVEGIYSREEGDEMFVMPWELGLGSWMGYLLKKVDTSHTGPPF